MIGLILFFSAIIAYLVGSVVIVAIGENLEERNRYRKSNFDMLKMVYSGRGPLHPVGMPLNFHLMKIYSSLKR